MGFSEERPWGSFENLYEDTDLKIKKIIVKPKKRLSLQSHQNRAENWIIVKGEAIVTLDNKNYSLKKNDSIFIPTKAKHRIANQNSQDLEFIEIQTGTYFGEDDIIRYEDDFNRI